MDKAEQWINSFLKKALTEDAIDLIAVAFIAMDPASATFVSAIFTAGDRAPFPLMTCFISWKKLRLASIPNRPATNSSYVPAALPRLLSRDSTEYHFRILAQRKLCNYDHFSLDRLPGAQAASQSAASGDQVDDQDDQSDDSRM